MTKEPNSKSENIPEGPIAVEKARKQSPFAYLKDWRLRDWLLGILSLVVCVAVLTILDYIPHIGKFWSWTIRVAALILFSHVITRINMNKKKSDGIPKA